MSTDVTMTAVELSERHRNMWLLIEQGGPAVERCPDRGDHRFGWFLLKFIGVVFTEDDPARIHVSLHGRGPQYRVSFGPDDAVALRYNP